MSGIDEKAPIRFENFLQILLGFRFLRAFNSEKEKVQEAQQTKLTSQLFNEVSADQEKKDNKVR